MAWAMPHIQDKGGQVKYFRRAYPQKLRTYLGRTQYRVSLGRPDAPDFGARQDAARAQYEANVALAEKKLRSEFASLTPELSRYLVDTFKAYALELDDEVRWTTRSRERKKEARANIEADIGHDLAEALEARALGDIGAISAHWGEVAGDHAESMGFLLEHTSPQFAEYVRLYHDTQIEVWQLTLARLRGENMPTPEAPKEPAWSRSRAVPLLATFDAYAAAKGVSAGVKSEWRNYVQHLKDFVGHDDASRLTRDDVVRWRDELLTSPTRLGKPRKAVTVRDKYIMALRCTLGWALDERMLVANVAADVKVSVPKRVKTRDPDFTMEEAQAILRATLQQPQGRLSAPYVRARRWIPWLCAYSGARVNELSQLRKGDVRQVDGHWIIDITPEAGSVKTRQARQVPVHAHVIEQGFLEAIAVLPDGPIFYEPARQRGEGASNRHFKKVGERLAQWVREDVGVNDPSIKPNHAWRHLFKTLAAEAGIQERVADAIQGHAAKSVAGGYGKVTLKTKAEALDRFPRFEVS